MLRTSRKRETPMSRKTDDALVRLEKWLLILRKLGECPWVRCIDPPARGCRNWRVELKSNNRSIYGSGKTLAAAIHNAVDQAEAER